MKYINGDKKRLFVNTSLGCASSCSYCYLPTLGIPISSEVNLSKTAGSIIKKILERDDFIPGKNGTIISIGCYSECWDLVNRNATKKIINSVLEIGNPVQIASKRLINEKDLEFVPNIRKWDAQLSIFSSCATISQWRKYESGTIEPSKRFKTLNLMKELNIPTCLYIKPVLKGVTLLDKELFSDVIHTYSVSCVVGGLFSKSKSNEKAPIGEGKLFYAEGSDEKKLIEYLSRFTRVYQFSTDYVEEGRLEC